MWTSSAQNPGPDLFGSHHFFYLQNRHKIDRHPGVDPIGSCILMDNYHDNDHGYYKLILIVIYSGLMGFYSGLMGFIVVYWDFIVIQWYIKGIYPLVMTNKKRT